MAAYASCPHQCNSSQLARIARAKQLILPSLNIIELATITTVITGSTIAAVPLQASHWSGLFARVPAVHKPAEMSETKLGSRSRPWTGTADR